LIDMPKDVQMEKAAVDWDVPMNLPGYQNIRPPHAHHEQIKQMAEAIKLAKRPVLYCGGGIISAGASGDVRELVQKTGIPVTMTLLGLGVLPSADPLCLDMLGMHGSVYSNWAVRDCDLLLALGVRFDDRVTGKLTEFAKHAKIVHIDIDPSELNKNKPAHMPVHSDIKYAMEELNKIVEPKDDIDEWVAQCQQWKKAHPFHYDEQFDGILPQHAISEISRLTQDRNTIFTTGVGQHQMWAAQFLKFQEPQRWLSSGGLGTMGFGLPAAIGAQAAHPDALVVDIDGDGSLQMNIQELATCHCEHLPVKVMLLNNQHLGMVVQWEDRFMAGNRAHTYLGPVHHAEATGKGNDAYAAEYYPDFVQIAKGYAAGGSTVRVKADLPAAIEEMINYDGPYVLDVKTPYQEHVLPMIPANHTVDDIILE